MGSQIIMGSALKIVATDRWYVKTCQWRQACTRSNAALKLSYIEMGNELNIGEEFNLGCSWARVHGGLEVGRKCLGRKMMRVDARVSHIVGNVPALETKKLLYVEHGTSLKCRCQNENPAFCQKVWMLRRLLVGCYM
jgi:hypothetical protein